MKGCHTCPHATEIAEGKYAGVDWEAIPCASCDVMSGAGFAIEFDEQRLPVGADAAAVGEVERVPASEDQLPLSVMRELVTGLLRLKPELRDVVAWRFAGVRYSDIALAQGVTQACAEKRHRRALELWPALAALFPRKVAKQGMRKKPGHQKESHGARCRHERSEA